MRRFGTLLTSTAALAISISLGATPGYATTLQEAMEQAYETNPTLLAERAQLRATDEAVAQAVSNWRPTVTVTGTYSDSDVRNDGGDGNGPLNNIPGYITNPDSSEFSGNLTATQNVFRGFRSVNQYRQAEANVRAGRAGLHAVEQQVLLDAVTAYLDVIRDQAVVELRQNNVSVLERQLEASQDRFDLGDSTRTDVAQAEARLSLARTNLIAAQAQETASRAYYQRVMGSMPNGLEAPDMIPNVPDSESQALSNALANNPTLQAAIESEVASRRAVDIAIGALLPSASVSARLAHSEDDDNLGTQTDSQTISGTVTVPLYQSGAEYSSIRAARQQNSADRIRIAETERQVRESVAITWDGLTTARSVIESSAEQVRANEIAFEGVTQEAQVGSRTTLDVLDAEQELLDSRVTLVTAQRDEQVAAYQLLAAMGALTAQDLGLNVQVYDPTRNYNTVRWMPFGWGFNE